MMKKQGHIDPHADRRQIMASIEQELYAIGEDLVRTAVEYLQRRNINVDGDIMKSVRADVETMKDGFRLQFGANAPHAIYVHEGTRPHWPPVKPIRSWVRKKLSPPTDEIDQVTFLVRRKISIHGTRPKPFLAVAVRAHINKLGARIGQAIERGAHAG